MIGKLGCHLDRHEDIGRGQIGLQAFREIVNEPLLDNIPLILETPGRWVTALRSCTWKINLQHLLFISWSSISIVWSVPFKRLLVGCMLLLPLFWIMFPNMTCILLMWKFLKKMFKFWEVFHLTSPRFLQYHSIKLWWDPSEVICGHMTSLKHLLFHRPGFEYAEQIELLYSLCEDWRHGQTEAVFHSVLHLSHCTTAPVLPLLVTKVLFSCSLLQFYSCILWYMCSLKSLKDRIL